VCCLVHGGDVERRGNKGEMIFQREDGDNRDGEISFSLELVIDGHDLHSRDSRARDAIINGYS
jgi:hypothetical protein